MSVGQRKIFNPHEELNLRSLESMLQCSSYHQATETLQAKPITKFTYDKHTVLHTAKISNVNSIVLKYSYSICKENKKDGRF